MTNREETYMQQVTLYFEGIGKAGILTGTRTELKTTRPCLLLTSDTHTSLAAILKSDVAVVEEVKHFIERSTAKWVAGGKKNAKPVTVIVNSSLAQNTDEIPTFNSHLNVPITLRRETTEENDCFLSVIFPSKEFLAMGGGQPKIIITQVAETEARINEILHEMAMWVAIRLGAMAAGA